MLVAGDGDSFSSRSSGGFDGQAAVAPAPEGFPGEFGSGSSMGVTITNDSTEEYEFSKGAPAPAAGQATSSGGATPSIAAGAGDRQVISQGSMSVEVLDVPAAAARVRAIAEGVGGFVEQLSSFGDDEFQQSTLTVRVPQDEFFSVFEQIKALGKVQNENAGSEDVTERFIDLEARLKSSLREEESLLSLLERAEDISDILVIERELTRVRTEVEQLQGQLNFLERRVDLATITVFLTPPHRDEAQAPSGTLSIESSNVGSSVNAVKAIISQVDGAVDQVFTSTQNGRERAVMTVRVFSEDFGLLVAAVEDQGNLVYKEIREGLDGEDSEPRTEFDEPNARLDISFGEEESSNLGRDLAIYAPIGSIGLVVFLALLFYGAYKMGARSED